MAINAPATATTRLTFSVVIPCYNEEATIEACVEAVRRVNFPRCDIQLVIVDDASTDSTPLIIQNLEQQYDNIVTCRHPNNQGKGAALRTGFERCVGEFVAIQDADLEYDPQDLVRLVGALIEDRADVCFGSRFLDHRTRKFPRFWHTLGNRALTSLSNYCSDLNLTDMETCYKVFRIDFIRSIQLQENGFGCEPELVAKVASAKLRIIELPISYAGRSYGEGKKIGVWDGVRAIYCIFKYNRRRAVG